MIINQICNVIVNKISLFILLSISIMSCSMPFALKDHNSLTLVNVATGTEIFSYDFGNISRSSSNRPTLRVSAEYSGERTKLKVHVRSRDNTYIDMKKGFYPFTLSYKGRTMSGRGMGPYLDLGYITGGNKLFTITPLITNQTSNGINNYIIRVSGKNDIQREIYITFNVTA